MEETSFDPAEASALLLARAQAGDKDALAELLALAAPTLRQFISIDRQWRPMLSEDDVIQVTFAEAFLRFDQFLGRNEKTFQAWLKKIASNNLRAAIRGLKSSRRPPPQRRIQVAAGTAGSHWNLIDELGVASGTPSRTAASNEAQVLIEEALNKLPHDYAMVIKLHYFDGLQGESLGIRIGRSRGAAYMLLARARDLLADTLGRASHFFTDSP